MPLTMYSPRPVPMVALGFATWTNLEKSCACLSLGMPIPVSATLNSITDWELSVA